jgi:beta-glucosidase/6-phospho-beta-glucosidase/beta-galactosidase/glycosyltransferase involved in cell wall biosynthesis
MHRHEKEFRWAVGIESSCIPHLGIDQFQWTQHDKYWKEDFKRAANELGCKWMRYSLPWHVAERTRGQFDWTWSDERLAFAKDLGINIILDLVHFGTPTWLPEAFGDIEFPSALEEYTEAFARQYRGAFHSVCAVNEPLITCLFSGDIGLWPPHGRGRSAYVAVLARVAQGISRSIRVLRELSPETEVVVCDALEHSTIEEKAAETAGPELMKDIEQDLKLRLHRRHAVLDLITGQVDQEHALFPWLEQHGFSAMDLRWFVRNPVHFDVLGLDYYCHSEVELYPCPEGKFRQRVPTQLSGLYKTVHAYWERYQVPMMITETSYYGTDGERLHWLERTVCDIERLRTEGVPMIGYTWWPLIDHIDWDGALLHQIGRIHNVGLYRLQREDDGNLTRHATPLTQEFKSLMARGNQAVGEVKHEAVRRPIATTFKPKHRKHVAEHRSQSKTIQSQPTGFPIVVHCHLRWSGVWQRPQQFLSRLSKDHPILFVEGPTVVGEDSTPRAHIEQVADYPNIHVMQTFFPASRFHDGGWVDAERLRLFNEANHHQFNGDFKGAVHWFYDPMAAPCFISKVDATGIVYDCMDELSQFKFAPPELRIRERMLLEAADVVFAGGHKLWQSKSRHNANAHFYGCGVDVSHFSQARAEQTKVPFDLDFVHRPILGYFGVIDERLDYELITKLAETDPNWSIVMIGPVVKVDPNALPNRTNIYWLGRRDYSQLPAYTKAFTACMMPFALNEATEFINPTKALEYMATGRPIISSAVPDVVTNFSEVVKVAQTHENFIELCRHAVRQPGKFNIEGGLVMAEQNGWDVIVGKLENHIHDVLRRKSQGHHPGHTTMAYSNV